MNGHRINMLPLGAVVIVLILGSPPIAGPVQAGMILVTGSPEKDSVSVNESFSVEITADIEENILGFGVDLVFDSDLLAVSGYEIAVPFLPLRSRDGDGLAALAYPHDVTGRNVPLLTVTFLPLAPGTAEIAVGITGDDPTEGFPEYRVGYWSEFRTVPVVVTIEPPRSGGTGPGTPAPPEPESPIPEPSTLLLLAMTSFAFRRCRGERATRDAAP